METVVVAAVSFLGVLFLASFIALLILCRHKYCNRKAAGESDEYSRIVSTNAVSSAVEDGETTLGDLELANIITCDDETLRQLLETEEWAFDAQGLIPHFISILKICREVTEKLVALTMCSEKIHPSNLDDIVQIARRITPRLDDVMNAIQPPFDSKLLEARCAALIFSVSHLAIVIKSACRHTGSPEWIDQALNDMDEQMRILRGVALRPSEVQVPHKNENEASCSGVCSTIPEVAETSRASGEQECSKL